MVLNILVARFGMLVGVVWWLDTIVSEIRAASVFRVEFHGEREVDVV